LGRRRRRVAVAAALRRAASGGQHLGGGGRPAAALARRGGVLFPAGDDGADRRLGPLREAGAVPGQRAAAGELAVGEAGSAPLPLDEGLSFPRIALPRSGASPLLSSASLPPAGLPFPERTASGPISALPGGPAQKLRRFFKFATAPGEPGSGNRGKDD